MKKKDFKEILKQYSLGECVSNEKIYHTVHGQVHKLQTTKGTYALKQMNKLPQYYKLQLEVISYLDSKSMKVPHNIPTKKEKLVLTYNKKKVVIQDFLQGKHLKNFSRTLTKELATNIARMHKYLIKSKFSKNKKGHRYLTRDLKDKEMLELQKNNLKAIRSINRKKLKQSFIHGDLSKPNILIKNKKLEAFIDFDDSEVDYLAYELAIFIAHAFVRKNQIQKKKIKLFLKTYQKTIKLNEEEKKAIYHLVQYRLFGILSWFIRHKHKKHQEGTKETIKRWYNYPIEEFMKLVN